MATTNTSKSILSISSPGTTLYASSACDSAQLTRSCNSYAASVKRNHPDKFGFWASLPLPFIAESLQEIDTALAEGADGFVLLTNYQGHYLGDAIFDPVFAALNDKRTRIFIHPTAPCTRNIPQNATSQCCSSASATNGSDENAVAVTTHQPATPLAHA